MNNESSLEEAPLSRRRFLSLIAAPVVGLFFAKTLPQIVSRLKNIIGQGNVPPYFVNGKRIGDTDYSYSMKPLEGPIENSSSVPGPNVAAITHPRRLPLRFMRTKDGELIIWEGGGGSHREGIMNGRWPCPDTEEGLIHFLQEENARHEQRNEQ